MTTLGLLFVLGGFLLGRQVVAGRVKETPEDIRDMTLALLSGDFTALQMTLAQRGENVSPDVSSTVAAGASGDDALSADNPNNLLTGPLSTDLLKTAVKLGSQAQGYRWGATGPNYYDCSGLVWAAMNATGQYTGSRFTTGTFVKQLGSKIAHVATPGVGDIVLWPGHHIGIVSGNDMCYSAMSPKNGIGYSKISTLTASIGGGSRPVYYRRAGI